MKLTVIQCPACGASLTVDDGLDTFFCMYCGNKILMEDPNPESIKAKVRFKEMDHEETVIDKKQAHEINKINIKEKNERHNTLVYVGIMAAILIVCAVIYIIATNSYSKEDQKLQNIVNEIQLEIAEENYDAALIKANTLYFTGDSDDYKKKWDDMRESLISLIDEKKGN